jgi:predicted membrane-bound spermidine synthase
MIVEILGAKMLSPYLGMSHFVWTAQIAVTLVALAAGYYAGGKLADRSPNLSRLYWAIAAAALYLAMTVLVTKPVAYWCLDLSLAVGSLLASLFLFFVPLALLAITGPFLVRVLTSSVAGVGGNVGRLTSIGTLGSLAGTLLIGYFIIPLMPNSVSMYATSTILLVTSAIYFLVFKRRISAPLVILLILGLAPGLALPSVLRPKHKWVTEQFRGNSHFGMLQVIQRPDGCRYYMNDFLVQDTYDPERKQSISHFTYMLSGLARASTTNISDVLCIGLGIGIVPMEFANEGAKVDVAEINPAVIPVAARYFDFQPEKMNITIDDGRHFLNRCRKHYDAVILDAFLGDSSPSHLFTKEAFASIQKVLRPGGVLVINSFGSLREGKDFFTGSLYKTLSAVFKSVRLFTSGDGGFFFTASDRSTADFVRPPRVDNIHPDVRTEAQSTYAGVIVTIPEAGRVLTDDYNPAEFYDAGNREEFRRRMATAAREM